MGSCCGVEENEEEEEEVCVESPRPVATTAAGALAKTVGAVGDVSVCGRTRAIPGPNHVLTRQMPTCIGQSRQTTPMATSAVRGRVSASAARLAVRGSRWSQNIHLAELNAKSEALSERLKAGEAMVGKMKEWLQSQGNFDRLNDPLLQVDHKWIELQSALDIFDDLCEQHEVGLRVFKK
eukprot:s572_g8.t1